MHPPFLPSPRRKSESLLGSMFRSVLRYLSGVITGVGRRAGRASDGGSRRQLISKHFCPLLLVLCKAPHTLKIKATVQHHGTSCNQWRWQKLFPCGRHLCRLVTFISVNEEMLDSNDVSGLLGQGSCGNNDQANVINAVIDCSPSSACDVVLFSVQDNCTQTGQSFQWPTLNICLDSELRNVSELLPDYNVKFKR